MELSAFDYDLPAEAIAQQPATPRDSSRLLVVEAGVVHHRLTRDFPDLVGPGDVVVVNNTRVLAARLALRKPTGGAVEVLVLEPLEGEWWQALVKPSRRVAEGTWLQSAAGEVVLEVGSRRGDNRLVRAVRTDMATVLDRYGAVPLPPYITAALGDPERYQTVFAERPSSVAAPTAGLHLTEDVLARCRAAGADVVSVDLTVGLGTFRPIVTPDIADHVMHAERYTVPEATWTAVHRAERVVAVGTTVVRTLEAAAASDELDGRTDLYITPGYDFAVVDALLTNFHLPRSSLLVMLQAMIGPGWRELYDLALAEGYRFLSFGDAMFVER